MAKIETNKGTYQVTAAILPINATDKTLTFSINANATVNPTGLVTAVDNGIAIVKAVANDGSGISGTLDIIITNQKIPITSIILT